MGSHDIAKRPRWLLALAVAGARRAAEMVVGARMAEAKAKMAKAKMAKAKMARASQRKISQSSKANGAVSRSACTSCPKHLWKQHSRKARWHLVEG